MLRPLSGGVFDLTIVDDRPGQVTLEASGKDLSIFENEAGGHRWQRIPPTEKRGRVQTSTVTVALLSPLPDLPPLNSTDLQEELFCKASGAGGQNVNKTATACRLIHTPTGLKVECCTERSQKQNRSLALAILTAKVQNKLKREQQEELSKKRNAQVSQDRRRSIIIRRNQVIDHLTDKTTTYERYVKGCLEDFAIA
jgi:peptide chain release factor 1